MLRLILAVLFALAGIALLVGGGPRQTRTGETASARPIGVGLLLLSVAFLAWSAVYRLDTGEAAAIKHFSGAVENDPVTSPGFHTKAPWDAVAKFDVRNQNLTFVGTGGDAKFDTDGITDRRITAQTKDNATAYIEMSMQYSMDPAQVVAIYRKYKTQENLQSRRLLPAMRGAVQLAPTRFATATLRQSRPQLTTEMIADVEAALKADGIKVDSIDLRNISFDGNVENSLNEVQAAAARASKASQDLETARIEAEKVRVDAQAQSDADQITRCGATSTTVKTTDASGRTVDAIHVTPVPANKCQNRLNPNVLTSKYIDMLREAAQKGNTVYVIPPGQSSLLQLPAK